MKPYQWMVMHTPQSEWIKRRGILLWLAFFFIELGAGIFFVASFFGDEQAMLTGWLVCTLLGGGLHLVFLGKPLRFWRMAFSSGWKTSWISRGLIFVGLFALFGFIFLVLAAFASHVTALLVIADVFAFLSVIYGGFAMNYVNGIPLWNTALLPVIYLVSGLWGGAEITLGFSLAGGGDAAVVEQWIRILVIGFILLIPIYLIGVRYTSSPGQASVMFMVFNRWSPIFWSLVVVIGMFIPLAAVISSLKSGIGATPLPLIYAAIFSGLFGDLAMRYLILRCGLYRPIIPTSNDGIAAD